MATKGTIESERFNSLLKKYNNNKTYIIGCTGLADAIEQGDLKKVSSLLEKEVGEYKGKVKNVVLGCTHYPLIQKQIEDIIGKVTFFNGANGVAMHLKEILTINDMKSTKKIQTIEFIDSKGSKQKEKRFFNLLKEIKQ